MDNKIDLTVTGSTVNGCGVPVGAAGSHDDVALRIRFEQGYGWEGSAKRIYWLDANGENPVVTVLTLQMRENAGDDSVYLVPIPAKPKAVAGRMMMSIRGAVVSDEAEARATVTATAFFLVQDSVYDAAATAQEDITPSVAEQIQQQIDGVFDKWENLTITAETGDAAAATATVGDTAVQLHFVLPKGDKGDKGADGAPGKDGANGAPGAKGDKGEKGEKGNAFTYADFTAAQLEALKVKGDKGDKGDTGAAFTYDMFTTEQLEALKVKGDTGAKGDKGETGAQGIQGAKGDKGDKGDTGAPGKDGADGKPGEKGDKGDTGDPGSDYVLTDADKSEIAALVLAQIPDGDEVAYG